MLYTGNYGANGIVSSVPSGTTNRVLQSPCIPSGPFDECTELSPCLNGATCNDLEDGYECICQGNYYGNNCNLLNECLDSPCINGGTCSDQTDGFSCACLPGHSGDICQITLIPADGCQCVPVVHPVWGLVDSCAEWGGYDGFCYVEGNCGAFSSQAIQGA